jgi:hypothetical protein
MKVFGEFFSAIFRKRDLTDSRLLGTWQSSGEMSAAYNEKQGKVTKPQMELLGQTLGILKLTYEETMVHSHGAEALKVTVNGKLYDWVFEDHKYRYEILAKSDSTSKIKCYLPWGKGDVVRDFILDIESGANNSLQPTPSARLNSSR